MKKFVSMAMVAAMTVSMVPATAFADGDVTASARIVDALELTKDEATTKPDIDETNWSTEVPELRLKITDASYRVTDPSATSKKEVTLELDNAEFASTSKADLMASVRFELAADRKNGGYTVGWQNATLGTDETHFVDNLTNPTKVLESSEVTTGAALTTQKDVVKYLEDHGVTFADGTISSNIELTTTDGSSTVVVVNNGSTWQTVAGKTWSTAEVVKALKAGTHTLTTGGNQIAITVPTAITGVISSTDLNAAITAGVTEANQVDVYEAENNITLLPVKAKATQNTTVTGTELQVVDVKEIDEDSATFVIQGQFHEDDVVIFDLFSKLDKTSKGKTATVSVSGDLVEADDLVYVSVLGQGITATTKKIANVAEEEVVALEKDLKIESVVGDFSTNQIIELKLNNGFEFAKAVSSNPAYTFQNWDEDYVELKILAATPGDEIVIEASDIEIEAVSAKSGDVATMKVKATSNPGFNASTTVEVAKVVDYTVMMSVDADEDVPVIYSGVNTANYGITDDSDHMSLEVTIEESFPGAWSMRKGFNLELPDGVYVTDVTVDEASDFYVENVEADESEVRDAFWNAYIEGDHKNFEFGKRVFDDVNTDLADDCATMTFELELVADPGFVGDVNLKLTGDLVDEQEVTIAKFETPFYVQAEQNDLKIDYRYTEVPTDIVLTEAEAGLWDASTGTEAEFGFYIEGDRLTFEDDPTFELTGELEIDDEEIKRMPINTDGDMADVMYFKVDQESDEAATVTITDIQLYMERNIPAGAYDLEILTSMGAMYDQEILFAPDKAGKVVVGDKTDTTDAAARATVNPWGVSTWAYNTTRPVGMKEDSYVTDVADFSTTVKEAFVNVVTAGREQDDASFTTKVVVPIGESYIVAGEKQVALDVPAYVSTAGYTMLPVRAVATALGINNNNVIWNGETKTVTILYGQRIITMVAGQKVVNVNGSVIPASAAVEIVDGRTFLPMRDLATALGVTDITWDAATKTATLNGGVTAE